MAQIKKRIFYLDALRTLAIICVILIHIYTFTRGNVAHEYPNISFNWIFTQIIGNPFRIGVDLFLMLSGALSLGREWEIKSFLSKRIPRIVTPFIFWNSILIISFILLTNFKIGNYTGDLTFTNYLVNALMGNALGFAPNWFFWMILGTYLFMPIINKWLLYSELSEAEYFLIIWIITALFDYTLLISFPIKLSYFTSPIGLVVLGYYLRHTERKIFKQKAFIIMMILIPSILMMIHSFYLSSYESLNYLNRYSLYHCIEVSGVFLLFRNTDFKIVDSSILYKLNLNIAKNSYGIYLFHYGIILILANYVRLSSQVAMILILFILTLILCLIIMNILNKIPYINQIIGSK